MQRTTKVKWGSLKVGIVLALAIAVMFWASLSGGGTSIFDSKGKFTCYFANVNGLVPGAPVWLSGVEVGNVKSIQFVALDSLRQVEIICRVKRDVWMFLTDDARVQMGTIGFLGDKYVEILPGTVGMPTIEEFAVIRTKDAGSAEAMFKKGEVALAKAGNIAQNVDQLLGGINKGEGTLGQLATNDTLYHDLTDLLAKLTQLTATLQKNQERIVSSLETTANSISSLTEKVDANQGTIGRLVNDPKLYDNLESSSARLDSIMQVINAADGSLGLFVSDTAFYSETVNLLERVNNLVTDIQNDPRKYFKFSVF
ncbi:MAG: MlaD family protein [bacterium]|nr:MlaD family protein [bacterium]